MAAEKKLLKPTDVAERWSVTRQHVYNLASRGELERVYIGKAMRITVKSVEDYERRQAA